MTWIKWLVACVVLGAVWYAPRPACAALIAYWDFEGDFQDSVGINHLTAHAYAGSLATASADGNDATTGVVAGRVGQSLVLDGIADGVSTQSNTVLDFTDGSSFTISMWVKLQPNTYDNNTNANPGDGRSSLLFRDSGALFNGYTLALDHKNGSETTTTQFLRGTLDAGAESNLIDKSTNIVADVLNDEWHHVAYVVKDVGSATGTTTLYLDGGVVASSTNLLNLATNGDGGISSGAAPLYLGSERANGNRWAKGAMDDVAIWSDALPVGSIVGLAQGTYDPSTTPIPEPSTVVLGLVALGGVAVRGRRIRNAS